MVLAVKGLVSTAGSGRKSPALSRCAAHAWLLSGVSALACRPPCRRRRRPRSCRRATSAPTPTRIEWWYVTGALDARASDPYGFQVTFFRRSRTRRRSRHPGAFAARQPCSPTPR